MEGPQNFEKNTPEQVVYSAFENIHKLAQERIRSNPNFESFGSRGF